VIPLSLVLLALFNLSLNLVVVAIFATIEGVRPMLSWLELPLLVAVLAVLSAGIAMLLSAAFVYFRDVQPIWEVINQVLFYASPIIIPAIAVRDNVSGTLFHLYMLNPLTAILQECRHAFITHATPGAADLLGSTAALAEPLAVVVAIFAAGFYVFNRTAPHVAEDL
jgi:ABC-2 type transport system permease protein